MTEKFVCLVVSTAVMVSAQADLFVALSEFRCDRKRCVTGAFAVTALSVTVCVVGAVQNHCDRTVTWTLLTCAVPMLIYFFCISRYRDVRFWATYCVANVSIALVDFFAYLLVLFLAKGNYTVEWIVRTVCVISWAVVIRLTVKKRWRKALALLTKGWWLIALTLGGMYGLMCMIAAYPTPIAQRPGAVPVSLAVVSVMLLGIIMGIRMVYTMLAASEQRERSQVLQSQLAMAKDQYAMLNENITQMRRLRHDMQYHIGVIYGLLQQGNYKKLQLYMRQYYNQLSLLDTALPFYTYNQTVNILAGYYARQAQEQGIECRMDIHIPAELPVDQTHLTALLGNMWRNALEACESLPINSYRFFHTKICTDGNKLIIKCKNSAPPVEKDRNGRFVSTKGEGRGSGLPSMEAIVAAHHGFSSTRMENGIFTFAAALEIK